MLTSFPAPVLSVAADAVRELEGRDALSGLWTLFTKCKESLQDGRRLENISWRLWYREMMLASASTPTSSVSTSRTTSEWGGDEKRDSFEFDEKRSYELNDQRSHALNERVEKREFMFNHGEGDGDEEKSVVQQLLTPAFSDAGAPFFPSSLPPPIEASMLPPSSIVLSPSLSSSIAAARLSDPTPILPPEKSRRDPSESARMRTDSEGTDTPAPMGARSGSGGVSHSATRAGAPAPIASSPPPIRDDHRLREVREGEPPSRGAPNLTNSMLRPHLQMSPSFHQRHLGSSHPLSHTYTYHTHTQQQQLPHLPHTNTQHLPPHSYQHHHQLLHPHHQSSPQQHHTQPDQQRQSHHHSPHRPSLRRGSSTSRASSVSVGKIICDMLPGGSSSASVGLGLGMGLGGSSPQRPLSALSFSGLDLSGAERRNIGKPASAPSAPAPPPIVAVSSASPPRAEPSGNANPRPTHVQLPVPAPSAPESCLPTPDMEMSEGVYQPRKPISSDENSISGGISSNSTNPPSDLSSLTSTSVLTPGCTSVGDSNVSSVPSQSSGSPSQRSRSSPSFSSSPVPSTQSHAPSSQPYPSVQSHSSLQSPSNQSHLPQLYGPQSFSGSHSHGLGHSSGIPCIAPAPISTSGSSSLAVLVPGVPNVPALIQPSTPSPPSTPPTVTATTTPTSNLSAGTPTSNPLAPPQLVVVNPTPNPTPHPTPPATPVLLQATSQRPQYLGEGLLPPPMLGVPSHVEDRKYLSSPNSRSVALGLGGRIDEDEGEVEESPVLRFQQHGHGYPHAHMVHRHSLSSTSSSSQASEESTTTNTSATTNMSNISTAGSILKETVLDDDRLSNTRSEPEMAQDPRISGLLTPSPTLSDVFEEEVPSAISNSSTHTTSNASSTSTSTAVTSVSPGKKEKRASLPPPVVKSASPLRRSNSVKSSSSLKSGSPSTKAGSSPSAVSTRAGSSIGSTSPHPPSSAGQAIAASKAVRVAPVRRTSSGASSNGRSRSTGGGSGKSASRSRSQEASSGAVAGAGATVLTMTNARPVKAVAGVRTARGRLGKPVRGRLGAGMKRVMSMSDAPVGGAEDGEGDILDEEDQATKEREGELEVEERKKREQQQIQEQQQKDKETKRSAMFNIGSNSDDGSGMGSKSAGSGSDASGLAASVGRTAGRVVASPVPKHTGLSAMWKGKQREKDYQIEREQRERDYQIETERGRVDEERRRVVDEQEAVRVKEREAKERAREKETEEVEKERLRLMQAEHAQRQKQRDKDMERQAAALVAAAAARLKETIAAPLLPQQQRRTIVLATSESDYETDSDEDEDGSWSSEEMSGEDGESEVRERDVGRQQVQHQPPQVQQQQQERYYPQRPAAPQRTTSTTSNAGPSAKGKPTRAQLHRHQAQVNAQTLVEAAAAEAQRQKDMFAKLPTSSFTNLHGASRTQSVGLLSQLMNPDPEIFPPTHPYRRGFSSGEIGHQQHHPHQQRQHEQQHARAGLAMQRKQEDERRRMEQLDQMRKMEQLRKMELQQQARQKQAAPQQQQYQHPQAEVLQQKAAQQQRHGRIPSMTNMPPLRTSKSAAALPVTSPLQVGSVNAASQMDLNAIAMGLVQASGQGNGGYRPKGRPQGLELEDDSDSDDEGGGIMVSKSAAEEKLKALAERRTASRQTSAGSGGERRRVDDDEVPVWAREHPPPQHQKQRQQQAPPPIQHYHGYPVQAVNQNIIVPPPVINPHPAPIPLGHPYNLPPPAAPSTPRTTRRQMLQTELSESLRRNLLWERQVSKQNLVGFKRTASTGGGRGNVLGGLRPLTAAPSMVQLTAKTNGVGGVNGGEGSGAAGDRERRRSGGGGGGEGVEDRDRDKKAAMARNRSWADDFHFKGW